jgi:hypothetical protein
MESGKFGHRRLPASLAVTLRALSGERKAKWQRRELSDILEVHDGESRHIVCVSSLTFFASIG